jgi:chloramphenicol 3-O-phosphotransferase
MRDDGRLVIALSGRTKAGKSTIAHALAERLGWPWASFGEYVRAEARRTGRPDDRETLQELGAGLITSLGYEEFCRRALAHAGLDGDSVPCIVEGVRHLDVLGSLRNSFDPFPVYLVHVEVADEERDRRLSAEGIDRERGAAWEQHSTERDVAAALPASADLAVHVGPTPESSVATIVAWLEAA